MYHQFKHTKILRSAHSVFMCFVWISEQTAITSLYSIYWLVFITEILPFIAQWPLYVPLV